MASRFPSLEEFDEGQTSPVAAGEDATVLDLDDPASDFLSREKATLGADADLFATQDDNNLLGGGGDEADAGLSSESAFPSLNMDNAQVGPGGTVTGTAEPYLPGVNTNAYGSFPAQEEEEPEVIRQWRERQALEIQRRDELSATRKTETVAKAQQAVDDFYENYNQKRDKAVEETRREAQEFLDARENTVAGGTAWERIAKLVDLSDKAARGGTGPGAASDKSRFREMLLSLRKDEKAPGASGF